MDFLGSRGVIWGFNVVNLSRHNPTRTQKNIYKIHKKHLTKASKNVAPQLIIDIDCEVHRCLIKTIFTH